MKWETWVHIFAAFGLLVALAIVALYIAGRWSK
jgi:hypothetical protein